MHDTDLAPVVRALLAASKTAGPGDPLVAEALVVPEANERQSNDAVRLAMGALRHCGCCRRCRC